MIACSTIIEFLSQNDMFNMLSDVQVNLFLLLAESLVQFLVFVPFSFHDCHLFELALDFCLKIGNVRLNCSKT